MILDSSFYILHMDHHPQVTTLTAAFQLHWKSEHDLVTKFSNGTARTGQDPGDDGTLAADVGNLLEACVQCTAIGSMCARRNPNHLAATPIARL